MKNLNWDTSGENSYTEVIPISLETVAPWIHSEQNTITSIKITEHKKQT